MFSQEYASIYDLFPWVAYDGDPLSVLVVEDDVFMQAQFTSLIRTLDYEVEVDRVTNVEDAIDKLEGKNFEYYDLVIADQFLEGNKTGLDLWRYCKKNHPDVRFILTSGEQLKRYLDRLAPTQGKPEFLGKPFSASEAIKKIEGNLKEVDYRKIEATIKLRNSTPTPLPGKALPTANYFTWKTHVSETPIT